MPVIDDYSMSRFLPRTCYPSEKRWTDLSEIRFSNVVRATDRKLASCGFPIPVRLAITEILNHLVPLDWLLFVTEGWYREHLLHQIRVALITQWLLCQKVFSRSINKSLPLDKVKGALWAAALIHDHGYALSRLVQPVQIMMNQSAGFHGRRNAVVLRQFCDVYAGLFSRCLIEPPCRTENENATTGSHEKYEKWIREYLGPTKVGLEQKILNKLLNRSGFYNHGLWSAMNLAAKLAEQGMPWDANKDDVEIVRLLIEAIAIHDHSDFQHGAFDMDRNPLSAILVLADELDEWKRVNVIRGKGEVIECCVNVNMHVGRMSIIYNYVRGDLMRAGWAIGGLRKEKKDAVERLSGAKGMPRLVAVVKATGKRRRGRRIPRSTPGRSARRRLT